MFNKINRIVPKFLKFTKNVPIKAKSVPRFNKYDEKLICYITGEPKIEDYCNCVDRCIGENETLDSLHERGIFPFPSASAPYF
jgi:hypothetical protein